MEKWAKRQEKVKMTFNKPGSDANTAGPSSATHSRHELSGDITMQMVEKAKVSEMGYSTKK